MPADLERRSYWAGIWADPEIAPLILQHGRIFALTQRNFENGLRRLFGSLASRTVLDFGCGDGRLLSRLSCERRILYEPSPVYGDQLAALVASDVGSHAATVAGGLHEIPPATVDLVVVHGVVQYMPLDELGEALRAFRGLLGDDSLGIIVADVPHPNRLVDTLGALFAHPTTLWQTAGQVAQLLGSRYASDRLQRHRLPELVAVAERQGFELRRLDTRSFNRARRTVHLTVPCPV